MESPGATEQQIRGSIIHEAERQGVSPEEMARQALEGHRNSIRKARAAAQTSPINSEHRTAGGGGDEVDLIAANSKGDIFVSPASTTIIEHGHTGLYFSPQEIIEAPGKDQESHKTDTQRRKVGKGAQIMNVEIEQKNKKDAAADYADQHLLGKG